MNNEAKVADIRDSDNARTLRVQNALNQKRVLVESLRGQTIMDGKSEITKGPEIKINELFGKQPSSRISAALNCVTIIGTAKHGLHYHTSEVVSIVLYGRGKIRFADRSKENETEVIEGDLVVIPSGKPHVMETDGIPMLSAVLEISDKPIDWQTNHYLDGSPPDALPPLRELEKFEGAMNRALDTAKVTVIKADSFGYAPANSRVLCSPAMTNLQARGMQRAIRLSVLKLRSEKPPHVHEMVVGQVIHGTGYIDNKEFSALLERGDIVIIPSGVEHRFRPGENSLLIAALEIY